MEEQNRQSSFFLTKMNLVRHHGMPDEYTFATLIKASSCSTALEQGRQIHSNAIKFNCGVDTYNEIEHYTCLVDGLGQAGCVHEAEKLIASIQFEDTGSMYRSLLGACRLKGDTETRTRVATKPLKLEPSESSTYVLLSNVYAAFKQWSEVADARRTMKMKNVKKMQGLVGLM
ncbi:Pentatricopeptide repeat-containing protein [Cynara cardunculus var. scolymus]|uniref:Pentatricopeptide repeat-containing protein n=1 Tax=Cynara cardunculus var. scolymus TaxID=59895 RepID=A0A103Y2W8_CYNCS|nr:Pentatricopeptide repeat-containing protein [Cynara cardunculus var. scolymus]